MEKKKSKLIFTGVPGSLELNGTRFQFSPESFVWRRIGGFPTIQPSLPEKLTELNL